MAFSLNRAQLIGNVTRDPEVKVTPGGQKVATFSVATNLTWTDSSGNKKEKAEFHNIVAWRKLAEIIESYVRKGQKIFIEGRLQTRDWEGEDGVKRYKTEIVADNMIMLGGKRSDASEGASMDAQTGASTGAAEPSYQPEKGTLKKSGAKEAVEEEVSLDDLPF